MEEIGAPLNRVELDDEGSFLLALQNDKLSW